MRSPIRLLATSRTMSLERYSYRRLPNFFGSSFYINGVKNLKSRGTGNYREPLGRLTVRNGDVIY